MYNIHMNNQLPTPRSEKQLIVTTFHGQWIIEYPGDVFVVFDPMTDGSGILGATRYLKDAYKMLEEIE